ncbi:MAG: hypothetical protein H0U74_11515 [Bradymonadaceae bacterium]|nr:hypothetical protein [Lujinxingiaceae bacterium]
MNSSSHKVETDALELEREWAEARLQAGLDPRTFEGTRTPTPKAVVAPFSPVLLLYSGFFLGPWVTLTVALLARGRRFVLREILIMVGLCGVAWCLIQGSMALSDTWSLFHMQLWRSALNFALGLALLAALRHWSPTPMVHTRNTYVNTLALAVFILAIYFNWRSSVLLVWLGR